MTKLARVSSLDVRAPVEVSLPQRDRELLERVEARLGEALELARRYAPLLELAAAFVPKGQPPDYMTAAQVRRKVKAWLR